jgi:hypothetical protein
MGVITILFLLVIIKTRDPKHKSSSGKEGFTGFHQIPTIKKPGENRVSGSKL